MLMTVQSWRGVSYKQSKPEPQFDPSLNAYVYTDEEGITHQYDGEKSAWFPVVSYSVSSSPQPVAFGLLFLRLDRWTRGFWRLNKEPMPWKELMKTRKPWNLRINGSERRATTRLVRSRSETKTTRVSTSQDYPLTPAWTSWKRTLANAELSWQIWSLGSWKSRFAVCAKSSVPTLTRSQCLW